MRARLRLRVRARLRAGQRPGSVTRARLPFWLLRVRVRVRLTFTVQGWDYAAILLRSEEHPIICAAIVISIL